MTSLSQYFEGIGVKRLSSVEIEPKKSNQHEFNGSMGFKKILGTERKKFNTKIFYMPDDTDKIIEDTTTFTWYDSRENHETRSEFRLYYPSNEAISSASKDDLLIIAKLNLDNLVVIIAPSNSSSEKQLLLLFKIQEVQAKFQFVDLSNEKNDIGFVGKFIINALGFETDLNNTTYLDKILQTFGTTFPSTKAFSDFARSTFSQQSDNENVDELIIRWMEREELLFKTFERYLVEIKLKTGFGVSGNDVDEFINFSLSVQNRRKARAGLAFENHLAHIFNSSQIIFTKKGKTERNNVPDFLFPGITYYKDLEFNSSYLTMLGVKTTVKDRWRQIVPEADRIWPKHLITLEPAISKNQTDEMEAQQVVLVLPEAIYSTFSSDQQSNALTLGEYMFILKEKQKFIERKN